MAGEITVQDNVHIPSMDKATAFCKFLEFCLEGGSEGPTQEETHVLERKCTGKNELPPKQKQPNAISQMNQTFSLCFRSCEVAFLLVKMYDSRCNPNPNENDAFLYCGQNMS